VILGKGFAVATTARIGMMKKERETENILDILQEKVSWRLVINKKVSETWQRSTIYALRVLLSYTDHRQCDCCILSRLPICKVEGLDRRVIPGRAAFEESLTTEPQSKHCILDSGVYAAARMS